LVRERRARQAVEQRAPRTVEADRREQLRVRGRIVADGEQGFRRGPRIDYVARVFSGPVATAGTGTGDTNAAAAARTAVTGYPAVTNEPADAGRSVRSEGREGVLSGRLAGRCQPGRAVPGRSR